MKAILSIWACLCLQVRQFQLHQWKPHSCSLFFNEGWLRVPINTIYYWKIQIFSSFFSPSGSFKIIFDLKLHFEIAMKNNAKSTLKDPWYSPCGAASLHVDLFVRQQMIIICLCMKKWLNMHYHDRIITHYHFTKLYFFRMSSMSYFLSCQRGFHCLAHNSTHYRVEHPAKQIWRKGSDPCAVTRCYRYPLKTYS